MEKFREKKEKKSPETYSLEQVQQTVLCVAQGILGIGKEEFRETIEELPSSLQKTIIAACMAAKEVQKEISKDVISALEKLANDQKD